SRAGRSICTDCRAPAASSQCRGSEIRFIFARESFKRISEPNDTRLLSLLVSFESEVRSRGRRKVGRTSDSGHWGRVAQAACRCHARGRQTTGRKAMRFARIIIAMLALAATGGTAMAQQEKSLREAIVGAWDFVVAEVTAPDGKKTFPFGETPRGLLIFTADGRFSQIHVASDLPKIASNNRLTGTPEEYAAIMKRSISAFGTYTIDETTKTVTYRIAGASFPNWEGEEQTRTIDKLTADEFVNTNPNVAGGRGSASNFYKRAK